MYLQKVTLANGIINIMQPLGFICRVIKCLTSDVATTVFLNVYLSEQYYQSVCCPFINAFFPERILFK